MVSMTTDPITGLSRPLTVEELEDRRRDRQWRAAVVGLFVLVGTALALTFWGGFILGAAS